MALSLAESYAYCRQVTRAAGSSFELAMRLFPAARREAVYALYAYFRLTDDLADQQAPTAQRVADLAAWREVVQGALQGQTSTHPALPALVDTCARYELPERVLLDCLSACQTDAGPVRLATWAEVDTYCDGVAGTVGEACLRILGETSPAVLDLSVANARAVQLTNILRDVDEDWGLGRVYLPAELLAKHQVEDTDLAAPSRPAHLVTALQEAANRADRLYRDAEPMFGQLQARNRPPIVAMTLRYRRLLELLRGGGLEQRGRARLGAGARLAVMGAVLASPLLPTWRQ
ncbi:MAG TPA: hypothetical protein DCZ72_10385 [Armatimonadetes bacterium]|nr:hypothetical protein [Armatimonadota bacterium]